VPVGTHPLDPSIQTGGAPYPVDRDPANASEQGRAFQNTETSQPKVDVRLDQELGSGGRMSYSGGYAGTEGIVHTGIGPFDLQSGSYMAYGRVGYTKGALKIAAFGNFLDAEAPNLLLTDPATLQPVQLNFKTQTLDFEVGHSTVVADRHILTYGGNARRNQFDITLAPNAEDRNEFGAYLQDEVYFDKFRLAVGARVDKFGNLEDPFFSPRVSLMYKPAASHSFRVSYNRAFRSPSAINNFLDQAIFAPTPVDLRALQPFAPAALRPFIAAPIILRVNNVGNPNLKAESLTAYEIAYTGTFNGKTSVGLAIYQNDSDDNINFTQITPTAAFPQGLPGFDVYTPANAPASIGVTPGGVPVPGALISFLAAIPRPVGPILLPRTVATYLNLGPLRQRGFEASIDHAFNRTFSAFANYSWQDDPEVLDPDSDQIRFPTQEITVPAKSRFNAGFNVNDKKWVGNLTVNYSDKAFWTDVLSTPFHGATDAYTMVNATLGYKWMDGKVTTSVKGTNIFNEEIQQHIFGDILKRSIVGEVKISVR
jgi:outer membrane receptor protein involved in Fe transport